MAESFDIPELLSGIGRRWKLLTAATVVAAGLVFALSVTQRPVYRATVQILIEPPPQGQALRLMMSPFYLESLQTYAHLARSREIVRRAEEELALTIPEGSVTAEVPRNTRVLYINAELSDPKQALNVARFVASQTIQRSAERQTSREEGGERLRIVDRGVEPADPVAPNVVFLTAAAAAFGLIASTIWAGLEFTLSLGRREGSPGKL